jgi:hypothetical protein
MIVYPDDVWIVTPPKCGTTWMQEIVWHIHTDVDLEKAQLNQFYRQEIFGFEKYMMKYRAVANGGAGGALAPQFSAKKLTLSQPGGQIIPTTVLLAPLDFQTLRRA